MTRHLAWILVLAGACTAGDAEPPTTPDPAGKPVAPIRIDPTEAIADGEGRDVDVEVSFTLLRDARDVTLRITPGDGMSMITTTPSFAYGDGSGGATFSETVTVRPDAEGVHYLKVLVSGTFDGHRMARSGAIPVRTSPDARRQIEPEGRIVEGADGTPILERPMEEKSK